MSRGKREKPTFAEQERQKEKRQREELKFQRKQREIMLEYSKRITADMRGLLWVISVGALLLAFLCAILRFEAAFPWITAMVGLPWTAWGTAAAFYLTLAKSDHKEGGITFEAAKAGNFGVKPEAEAPTVWTNESAEDLSLSGSEDSPAI